MWTHQANAMDSVTDISAAERVDDAYVAGCLDHTLDIFERHVHPFIVVGVVATTWCSSNSMPGSEIDLLLKSSAIPSIVDDLVASGEWAPCKNPYTQQRLEGALVGDTHDNTTAISDTWLVTCKPGYFHPLGFRHLRLWPEELYHLSADCHKIQIPDIYPVQKVLLEEEYHRDPHGRFGPCRLSVLEAASEPILQSEECRFRKSSPVAMFIPRIEDHLNALLDQLREEIISGKKCGNMPSWHIRNFIRYHVWDWPPASAWLLDNKIHHRNDKAMRHELQRYVRKQLCMHDRVLGQLRTNIYPWELTPPPAPT